MDELPPFLIKRIRIRIRITLFYIEFLKLQIMYFPDSSLVNNACLRQVLAYYEEAHLY